MSQYSLYIRTLALLYYLIENQWLPNWVVAPSPGVEARSIEVMKGKTSGWGGGHQIQLSRKKIFVGARGVAWEI